MGFLKLNSGWSPLKGYPSLPRRFLLLPLAAWLIVAYYLLAPPSFPNISHVYGFGRRTRRMPSPEPLEPLPGVVPCLGARGLPLDKSPDDELRYGELDTEYPTAFAGSQAEMGLGLTWMSADGRYGPYGYGQDSHEYTRTKVDWDKVDWGELMDQCSALNVERYPIAPATARLAGEPRFALFSAGATADEQPPPPLWHHFEKTRRTALVIRAYEDFKYTAEDLWFIRSLITEASLRKGGEYSVVLLVNINDMKRGIFKSPEAYQKALGDIDIPPELRSITLLWDDGLLNSWYATVEEHRTMWQVNQPMQLFALYYPEYDHYWQVELDQRFLGDAGEYLDALSESARQEPRKQALERSTFAYSTQVSGTYKNFTRAVDEANHGQTRAWGHLAIKDIDPIGPEPPVPDATQDSFTWGVGEDADVIVTGFCADIRTADWLFRDFITGFSAGTATPRFWCPPAVARASRALLHAVHADQHLRGMSIPSEAVFPTWALWLGLKLSFPPQPAYMHRWTSASEFDDETSRLPDEWHNDRPKKWFGYAPDESPDGLGLGEPVRFADRGYTWWWVASYPRRIMNVWLFNNPTVTPDETGEAIPHMLRVKDGIVYAPNFAMHPVKT